MCKETSSQRRLEAIVNTFIEVDVGQMASSAVVTVCVPSAIMSLKSGPAAAGIYGSDIDRSFANEHTEQKTGTLLWQAHVTHCSPGKLHVP